MHHRRANVQVVFFLIVAAAVAPLHAQENSSNTKTMSLDVKDTDIRDAIRMISKGYDLNIVLDKDVSGKVTVHLTDVPIMDGLRTLTESHGFEVVKEGSVYRIRTKTEEGKSSIRYRDGKLTVDVENVDVREFLQELSSKTGASIVPDSKVRGRISGKLYEVELDDGLRALLEGNGYTVSRRRNIYQVSVAGSAAGGRSTRRIRRRPAGLTTGFFIDFNDGRLTLEVSNGNLEDVIKAIAEQADVQIVTYGSLKAEVNATLFDVPLTEAFALLLGGTRYTFVEKDEIILIGDRNAATPSGQALSKSEMVHLDHIKADEVPKILPKNISANNIKVIKEQNALLVSGTSEDIVKVKEFLNTIDIPTPQVRIDAIIVEFKEGAERGFGLSVWKQMGSAGEGSYLTLPGPQTRHTEKRLLTEWGFSAKELKKFLDVTSGVINDLPDNLFLILQFLESESMAKVLAKPSIVTLNGHKATITVDETQYFKIVTGVAENYTLRFQPIKFGIRLNITPWISQGGQITAEISPEVSNSEGQSKDNYPNVASRSLNTTVRLSDGQTLALGGLIRDSESKSADKVPILGDLPIIGALFRNSSKTRNKTNLVIYITPHIITAADTVDLEEELRMYDLNTQGSIEERAADGIRGALKSISRPGSNKSLRDRITGQDENPARDTGVVVEETDVLPPEMAPDTGGGAEAESR